MEDLHIIKEKMLELMRSLSYSDGVIRGTRIVIDRYIDYVHLNNLSVNIDTVLSFSDLYPKLSSRCCFCQVKIAPVCQLNCEPLI